MQKILRKRVLRDLKENFFRYLALGLLIILCMYMIGSLVGAGETIVQGVDEQAEKNHMEDGQFTWILPSRKRRFVYFKTVKKSIWLHCARAVWQKKRTKLC